MGVMPDEPTIVARAVHGDHDAYRALVERYHIGLIIHCERMLDGERAAAEDIAQEAFFKAYQQLSSYDAARAKFSTWLYRIATNLTIDYLRKARRHVDVDDIEVFADVSTPETLKNDEIAAIHAAVDQLEPPVYAEVVRAYFWEGKSYQQIAREHHTTTGTIGTWLSRAKAQLQEELA